MHTDAGGITQFTMPYSCLNLAGSSTFFLFTIQSYFSWFMISFNFEENGR